MTFILVFFLCFSPFQQIISEETNNNYCNDRNKLIAKDKNSLTEVIYNATLKLECHVCEEMSDNEPKLWYKLDIWNKTKYEVQPDMNNDQNLNRITITPNHTLIIRNVTINDTGVYYCLNPEEQDQQNEMNVDVVFESKLQECKGNLGDWRKYHDENIQLVNNILSTSNDNEYSYLRDVLKIKLEVFTEWDVKWTSCDFCDKPKETAVTELKGFCRIKIRNINKPSLNNNTAKNKAQKINYFVNSNKISCGSVLLDNIFPDISKKTQKIPSFVLVKQCDGVCNPDAVIVKWKAGKTKGFKYRKSVVLDENSHATFVCPESSHEDIVIWRKSGVKITPGKHKRDNNEEPHVIVDIFNTLYLLDVSVAQEGNYTCQVDDLQMQQIRVFIVEKSKLLTKKFLRHLIYLSFVLMLSLSCYCGGCVIACKRRNAFEYNLLQQTEE